MGRPLHADGERTRQAILDAALRFFAKKGYFGTSLRDIATAVGVRESALYNYFRGKEALFEALISADQQRKEDALSAMVKKPIRDVRTTLTELAVLALEHFSTSRQQQLFCLLMSDGIRLAREGRINLFDRMNVGHTRLHGLMRQLIRDGTLRRADPQWLAMEFVGPLLLWRHLRAVESTLPAIRHPRAFARHHVDQFLQGAAARSTGVRPLAGKHSRRRSLPRRSNRVIHMTREIRYER